MSVSIVIPCYNQGKYLGEAIESCFRQPAASEVIVVDDGSTDDTRAVAQSFPRIRYVHQENRGLCKARNRGFHESSGNFVNFLDSDDRLPDGAIDAGLTALSDAPKCVFAYGGMTRIGIDGGTVSRRDEPTRANPYRDLLETNYITTPGMVLFRRSVLRDLGLFDPAFPGCADYDVYLRITRTRSVVAHAALAVERRVHPESMSLNAAQMLRESLLVHRRQWPHVENDGELRAAYRRGRARWK
jgi:glycosyltransferase involved in cell wall biosynthesis